MTLNAPLQLLSASSTTGPQIMWQGGPGLFAASGTWGGGTVTLEFVGPDGETLIPAGSATTLTANGSGEFNLPHGLIQATITDATDASLYATASPLPMLVG